MKNDPLWAMHLPVISTDHMPSRDALRNLASAGARCALYDEGGFAYLPDTPSDTEAWTEPVLAWLREHFDDHSNWVRFDADADVIDGLPIYNWGEV